MPPIPFLALRPERGLRSRLGLTLGLLFSLGACQAPKVAPEPPEAFVPTLTLRPTAVLLSRGASQVFQAEINYAAEVRYFRQPVAWRVVEPGGGTLTPAGLYTAPATPGTYHVQVRREDHPSVSATATVTVK